jgi:Uma2 family endonuclease
MRTTYIQSKRKKRERKEKERERSSSRSDDTQNISSKLVIEVMVKKKMTSASSDLELVYQEYTKRKKQCNYYRTNRTNIRTCSVLSIDSLEHYLIV